MMPTINYSYAVNPLLDAAIDCNLSWQVWKDNGEPCISADYVSYNADGRKIASGAFTVNRDQLEAFAERGVDVGNIYDVLQTFEDMLSCENYVENIILSQGVA